MMSWPDNLHIGTCSWKYDSWRGLVYTENSNLDYLTEYAEQYNTVEIDQWFWSLHRDGSVNLPGSAEVSLYGQSVPDSFRFTIKLPNSLSLTHFYRKTPSESLEANPYFLSPELYVEVLGALEPLLSKAAVLMLQFEYLNRQKMNSQEMLLQKLNTFINKIQMPVPLGVEIRNPNYLNPRLFAFLQSHHLVPVFVQGYYMPSIVRVIEQNARWITETAVIRLHGPDREGIEKASKKSWNKIIAPKDEELVQIIGLLKDMIHQDRQIYLNVNNHYEGSAPLTIQKIHSMFTS